MKTDNSNIVVDQIEKAYNELKEKEPNKLHHFWSFENGFNASETKYKDLVQSHAELLEVVKDFCDCRTSAWRGKLFDAYHKGKDAIQKTEKINIQ